MCRMQPSRLSPAQPRERPSETCDMKAHTPEVMPHGGLNIIVPEQGGQILDRQAVWIETGPGTRRKYLGAEFPMAGTEV